MSIHPVDLILLSTASIAALMGILWVSVRMRAQSAAQSPEMPTLRLPRRRVANDNNMEAEEPPISGIRLKLGAKEEVATLHSLRAPRR